MQIEERQKIVPRLYCAVQDTCLGRVAIAETEEGEVAACGFADTAREWEGWRGEVTAVWPEAQLEDREASESGVLESWFEAEEPVARLLVRGTPLQVRVWQALLTVPRGEVISYGQLAERVEQFHAYRAVGQCVGKNRLALLIPCHRVLRADGGLGGYHWGEARKRAILEWESGGGSIPDR